MSSFLLRNALTSELVREVAVRRTLWRVSKEVDGDWLDPRVGRKMDDEATGRLVLEPGDLVRVDDTAALLEGGEDGAGGRLIRRLWGRNTIEQ
jgi:hypothetical protein